VSFGDQVADHRDEGWGGSHRRRPLELHTEALAEIGGLGVEIVEDFHVIGDEADRRHHDPVMAVRMKRAD
jgi:hypothetical protein